MRGNQIKANGTVAITPRYVATAINHPVRGRLATVRDNFPTTTDENGSMLPRVIFRRRPEDGSYVAALAAGGWKLTGPWQQRADGSFAAVCERA